MSATQCSSSHEYRQVGEPMADIDRRVPVRFICIRCGDLLILPMQQQQPKEVEVA